jgi:hypothetical protein
MTGYSIPVLVLSGDCNCTFVDVFETGRDIAVLHKMDVLLTLNRSTPLVDTISIPPPSADLYIPVCISSVNDTTGLDTLPLDNHFIVFPIELIYMSPTLVYSLFD